MNLDPTPFELVTSLRSADGQARAVLEGWCGESLTRLVAKCARRLGTTSGNPKVLNSRALRWLEMYLRARDPSVYQGVGRRAFVMNLMLATYRWLDRPDPNQLESPALIPGEPNFDAYKVRSYMRPLDPVGGDWRDHEVDPGRVLWVIIGDVTGHGYFSSLAWRLRQACCWSPQSLLS